MLRAGGIGCQQLGAEIEGEKLTQNMQWRKDLRLLEESYCFSPHSGCKQKEQLWREREEVRV